MIWDSFTAHECFELGRTSYETSDYYHTILWMKEALVRLPDVEGAVNRIAVLDFLTSSLYQVK